MTQVTPAPSITGSQSIRQIPTGNGEKAGFSLALGAQQAPARMQARPGPETRQADPKRHPVAGGGKELPEEQEATDPAEDETKTEADPAFAWFGIALPTLTEATPMGAFGQPVAGAVPGAGEGEAAPLPTGLLLAGLGGEATAAPTDTVALPEGGFQLPDVEATEAPITQLQTTDAAKATVELAAKIELPADSPLLKNPVLQTIAALQPRGESQPMAALAASAGIELPEQFRRPAQRETTTIGALTPQTGTTEVLRPNVVQSVADAQQAAIDTRRAEWMSQTIDRIEALRDSPNSRETSIRLSPDALGKVDVSIRHEGDKIHVRFSAENAQARTLLTEAQSRLTEIAEARGVKLGQTSVDAGTAGQGQRHDAAPRNATNIAPVSVLSGSETLSTLNADARVA